MLCYSQLRLESSAPSRAFFERLMAQENAEKEEIAGLATVPFAQHNVPGQGVVVLTQLKCFQKWFCLMKGSKRYVIGGYERSAL